MSLNYNVQEHLIIDLDRAGAAGSAVWEALVEQVRALEDLLDEDGVCIYRLELWADGEPVPVENFLRRAGPGAEGRPQNGDGAALQQHLAGHRRGV